MGRSLTAPKTASGTATLKSRLTGSSGGSDAAVVTITFNSSSHDDDDDDDDCGDRNHDHDRDHAIEIVITSVATTRAAGTGAESAPSAGSAQFRQPCG
jgi:hypothetical protein